MILLSKCKWLEAMLGAKNTEWTETQTTAQPQCQASEDPYRILMRGRCLRTRRPRSGRSKLLTCWGTESGRRLSCFVFVVRERLSHWGQRGSELEREALFLWAWRTIAHPFQSMAEALLLKWMVYVLILEKNKNKPLHVFHIILAQSWHSCQQLILNRRDSLSWWKPGAGLFAWEGRKRMLMAGGLVLLAY